MSRLNTISPPEHRFRLRPERDLCAPFERKSVSVQSLISTRQKVAGNKTRQRKMNVGLTIYFSVFSKQIQYFPKKNSYLLLFPAIQVLSPWNIMDFSISNMMRKLKNKKLRVDNAMRKLFFWMNQWATKLSHDVLRFKSPNCKPSGKWHRILLLLILCFIFNCFSEWKSLSLKEQTAKQFIRVPQP